MAGSPTFVRLLVLDAYPRDGRAGRAALTDAGGTEAGPLYAQLLRRLTRESQAASVESSESSQPSESLGLEIDIAYPADSDDDVPSPSDLSRYAGAVWTGSSLSIINAQDAPVRRQVDLARKLFELAVPSFGSCWAAQLAVVAAGGSCEANPRGREFGISRRIALSAAGRAHPLYRDKAPVFDAFTSHADHIAKLPARACVLASNDFSPVQAVAVEYVGSSAASFASFASFWAVQYHPEYDLREVASLCRLRADELIAQGIFRDAQTLKRTVDAYEALQRDPTLEDVALEFDVSADLLDAEKRTLEVRNWLACQIVAQVAA